MRGFFLWPKGWQDRWVNKNSRYIIFNSTGKQKPQQVLLGFFIEGKLTFREFFIQQFVSQAGVNGTVAGFHNLPDEPPF